MAAIGRKQSFINVRFRPYWDIQDHRFECPLPDYETGRPLWSGGDVIVTHTHRRHYQSLFDNAFLNHSQYQKRKCLEWIDLLFARNRRKAGSLWRSLSETSDRPIYLHVRHGSLGVFEWGQLIV